MALAPAFDLDEARAARERIRLFVHGHEAFLQRFWFMDGDRGRFALQEPFDRQRNHVTNACTCALSFLEVLGGSLPSFVRADDDAFLQWLEAAADKDFETTYALPFAFSALVVKLVRTDPGDPAFVRLVDSAVFRRSLEFLCKEMPSAGASPHKTGGVAFHAAHPPSGFLTYWAVRALSDVVHRDNGALWRRVFGSRRGRTDAATKLERAIVWSEVELYRQFSYYSARDFDRFDCLQMAYALALCDFDRGRRNSLPDRKLVARGLEILFESQLPNGLWPQGRPIFHAAGGGVVSPGGDAYSFPVETLTAVMQIGSRETDAETGPYLLEFFGPHVRSLLQTAHWAELNQLRGDKTFGWRSPHVPPGDVPQAWATAMVLAFFRVLDALLGQITREHLLAEFHATRPVHSGGNPSLPTRAWKSEEFWTRFADSETRVRDTTASLKELIADRVIGPHLGETRHQKMWSMILCGPPATAKTELARTIADALSWPLISIGFSDFLAQGLDRTAYQAGLIFQKLEDLSRAVVLIDEVEELVRDRAGSGAVHEGRVLTAAMLPLIQSVRSRKTILLILATNHISAFDVAIKRRGRFDLILVVLPPSFEEKLRLLRERLKVDPNSKRAQNVAEWLKPVRDDIERLTYSEWDALLAEFAGTRLVRAQIDQIIALIRTWDRENALTIKEDEWRRWTSEPSVIHVPL